MSEQITPVATASASETAPQPMNAPQRMKGWVVAALLAAIVAIFVVCFALAPKPSDGDAEAFGGTDAAVTEVLEDRGVEPWLEPLFEPGSGEIESGLFALQAALGAGALGFVLGNLRGRSKERSLHGVGNADLTAAGPLTPGVPDPTPAAPHDAALDPGAIQASTATDTTAP